MKIGTIGIIGGVIAGAAVPFVAGHLNSNKFAAPKPSDFAVPAIITALALPAVLIGASLVIKQPTVHKLLLGAGASTAAGAALIGVPLITFAANSKHAAAAPAAPSTTPAPTTPARP
jgi:hypothetical protein